MNHTPANRVTLNDVLRLVLPLDTTVVGGDHSGRIANWVTVLTELSQLEDQVHAGDIVMLPVALQENAALAKLASSLQAIVELGAAALLTFRPISEDLTQLASRHDLPIVIISGDETFRDIHQGIAGLLVNRQKQIAERGLQLYRKLTEMSREGQSFGAMTNVMSKLSGKIVAVQDKRLDIIALTIPPDSAVGQDTIRAFLRQPDRLPKLLQNRKAAANTPQSYWQQLLPIGDRPMARLISPIISGDRARGYVSVVGTPDNLDMLDMLTTQYGAAACALEMAKAKAISEVKKALRGDFLEGLLAGTLPEAEIYRLAGRLDHDTSSRHAIITFSWDGEETPSLRRLESPLHWLISDHCRPAFTHIYSNDHVCVFQSLDDGDSDLSTAFELASKLRSQLLKEFPESRLLCGISGPAEELAQWPETYHQAVQAMHLASQLKLDEPVDFNSIGVYQLLTEMEDLPMAQRYCDQIIGPLVQYDKSHSNNLVQTIDAYFNHHGNISQTAEMLFIHRNTLLYRLDRIQELTGQDLDNANDRLALQLALKLSQLLPNQE
jgi:purine catabolism regulator